MEGITTLTVGRVSGLIAFGNFVLTATFPLLLAIVLAHRLSDKLSAASWSVLARQLHSTLWPSILQADSVAGKHVYWSVSTLAYTNIGLAVLGVLSGVVTPLGLGDQIRPAENRDVNFRYAPDLSSFGRNTIARPDMPLSRDCLVRTTQCPGAIVPGAVINQGSWNRSANPDITATTRIPKNITEMFSSASKKSSIAGILDIQYRFWLPYTSEYFDGHKPYPRGQLLSLESLISRDDITLVEGLIADMHSGGIGFRNHSMPSGMPFGAEWDEDILWVEPEISCVNTNLTYELTLADTRNGTFSPPIRSIELVDEGGFSDLRHGDPYNGWPNITYTSPDPQLRADRSAWLNNFLAGITYNLTDGDTSVVGYGFNVTRGQRYPIAGKVPYFVTSDIEAESLSGAWLNLPSISFDNNGTLTVGNRTIQSSSDNLYWWTIGLFTQLKGRCLGQYNDASLENEYNVECGQFFGAASRVDGGNPLFKEAGSKWRKPIYICAGAVKSSVKTVSFVMNGTASLESLAVKNIKDKQYSNPDDHPLWALEDWWHPGSEGAFPGPLWGIVDDSYKETPGYNFTRAPSFYLPFSYYTLTLSSFTGPRDNLAGVSMPYGIMGKLLTNDFFSKFNDDYISYSGTSNVGLGNKWRNLSKTPDDASKLLRLIWTDIMTSNTVGTNMRGSALSGASVTGDGPFTRTVRAYDRKVTYDLRFAIPAILFLVSWVLFLFASLVMAMGDGHPFTRLKKLLNDTSVGRVAASLEYPESRAVQDALTKDWLVAAGHLPVRLSGSSKVSSDAEEQEGNGKTPSSHLLQPKLGDTPDKGTS
ncbi:hypothetical protein MGYG_03038 [Nannizzia gypsea CBS 118893]|uniref:Uncharacterized protein n=1 Tax=Arthroderma gypseum (strain ATCC MYA-4604 / CBS 118893) TaxID=535722 RepID=E4UQG2_ARTGP|nr:hypothetical protein MGYG_03038 [Nannizzia gypsea CBS 118893]EFR00032.1 hypothetical protein MGYG_03038 [Nannizzia gypsea CBS 118893]